MGAATTRVGVGTDRAEPSAPADPAPSRVAIRRSREKQRRRKRNARQKNSKRAEKLLELEATLVQNHRTEPPPRRATSAPLVSPGRRRGRSEGEHASRPQPLRRGRRRGQPLLRERKTLSPPRSEISLPT